jgi:hypothetical protein
MMGEAGAQRLEDIGHAPAPSPAAESRSMLLKSGGVAYIHVVYI